MNELTISFYISCGLVYFASELKSGLKASLKQFVVWPISFYSDVFKKGSCNDKL